MTSAPPLPQLTTSEALPLDGHQLHLDPAPPAGLATATEVVRDHLTRLGARFGPGTGPWHPGGSAGVARDRYATAGPETVIGLGGSHRARGTDLTLRGWPAGDPTPFDETTAQAATGLMALHGRANGGPRPLGTDFLSALAGTVATQALLAAALSGLRGVPVRSARVSVAEAALFSLGPYVAAATAEVEPEEVPSPPYRRAARPPFLSADGVRSEVEALDVQPWRDFWKAVGAPAKDTANSWRAFAARHARAAAPLITTLARSAARHRYADLQLLAERTGMGMGICALRTLADRRADSDVRYDDDPWELRELPRDDHDGLPTQPYAASRPHTGFPQLPLGGLRVVESTRNVQGPLATSVLQALGAHVIRIEQPGGDPARGTAPLAGGVSARFAALNAGKDRVLPLTALDPAHPAPHGRPRTTPYRMAFAAVGTVALAGVLLGAARAALDAYAGSGTRGSGLDVSAHTATVDTARALLLAGLDRLAASSTPGGTAEERARMRRDIAYAGTRCREVVNAVYEASGSAVIYDDAPVQRIWRDANAAAQHPAFDLRRRGATPS